MEKPTPKHTRWRTTTGRHDILHPEEKQVCLRFIWRDDFPQGLELSPSYTVDYDDAPCFDTFQSPLSIALWLREYYKKYIYSSSTRQLADVIHYLRYVEPDDARDKHLYEWANAEYQIWHWQTELERIKSTPHQVFFKEYADKLYGRCECMDDSGGCKWCQVYYFGLSEDELTEIEAQEMEEAQ